MFDKYFSYLQSIEGQLPPALAKFALDESRYELQSDETLHDAWLTKLSFEKKYFDHETSESVVTLELLHSSHESVCQLSYSDVVTLEMSSGLESIDPYPSDLLVHEFSLVSLGLFQHLIHFDHGEWIRVVFRRFSAESRIIF
jgi:hypothetical protein